MIIIKKKKKLLIEKNILYVCAIGLKKSDLSLYKNLSQIFTKDKLLRTNEKHWQE